MTRVLTTIRVGVPASHRGAYLETLAALAACQEARGNHLWLFALQGSPDTFLECSEGTAGAHRVLGPVDATESRLEARLAELGAYQDVGDRWEEVSLSSPPKE